MKESNPCFCVSVRGLANRLTQLYDDRMAPFDLKVTQYSVMKKIVDKPNSTISEIAQMCDLDRTTLTRSLRILERDGWLEFVKAKDQREKRLQIKATKTSDFDRAQRAWQQVQKELSALIDLDPIRKADEQLSKINAGTK
jgi:DNA-binding MarR family transcriptional regulator